VWSENLVVSSDRKKLAVNIFRKYEKAKK